MPHIEAIDLRRAAPPRGRFISPPLAEQIQIAIGTREQALLFLNRRGYAPLTLCRACGHRLCLHIATPGWSNIAFASAWSATIAASRCRGRTSARIARRSNPLVAVGPGVERLQEEAAGAVSRRAHHGAVERSDHLDRDHAQRAERDRAKAAST